jgi:hypothetical protein
MNKLLGSTIRWMASLWLLINVAWMQASAQLPVTQLEGIFPAGGRIGETVEVTISGTDLDDVNQLIFSNDAITAKQKLGEPTPFDEGPQPIENQFVVTIGANVPAGRYEARCRGKYGISGPRSFNVVAEPGIKEVEPNKIATEATDVPQIPAVLYGQFAAAADIDMFQFKGTQGQRLTIHGKAAQIDSPVTQVLALVHANGRVLAESKRIINKDPVLDVKLPETGTYFIKTYDLLYGGGAERSYSITISSMPTIDFVFPPVGTPGSQEEYTIYGHNLPGSEPSEWTQNGVPLERLKTRIPIPGDVIGTLRYTDRLEPFQAMIDGVEYRVASANGPSNAVLIGTATGPLTREIADNDKPETAQPIQSPCEVIGQFYPRRDVDWYRFDAKKDEELWIDILSHRLGAATDSSVVIFAIEKDAEGKEKLKQLEWVNAAIQRSGGPDFDNRHNDPSYKFKAPADGTYRLLLRDSHSTVASDPGLIYRLAVRPAQADYRLAVAPMDTSGSILMRKGGRESVRVVVFRQDGFAGEIKLTAEGLPGGVTAPEMTIGPDCNQTVFSFSAAADAPEGIGEIRIKGTSTVNGNAVTRIARISQPMGRVTFNQPNDANQAVAPARLVEKLPVVVSGSETERITIAPEGPPMFETSRGGIVKVKYKATRQPDAAGTITGFVFGLPTVMNFPQFNFNGDAGEIELRFPANMQPGEHSINIAATVQGMSYSRNPEAAARAKERQTRIADILTMAQKANQEAQQAATKANTELTQAGTRVQQATTAKNTADQALTAATTAQKTAQEALNAAKAKSEAAPEDAALKTALVAAEKALTETSEKMKAATNMATEAATKLETMTKEQMAASEAKKVADQKAQEAQKFQQQATQQKQQADQKAQQAQQQANNRNVNHLIYATPITIRVADYPVKLKLAAEQFNVKQGEKVEVPISIERLYEFNQQVNVQAVQPQGVSGLQINNASIPNGTADGKIMITAQPNATVGNHVINLRVTLNFNGQNLTFDRSFNLAVEEVKPAK